MGRLARKRFISRLTRHPLSYVVLVIFAGLFTYKAFGAYSKSRVADKRLNSAQEELANLQVQKDKLTNDLENSNTSFGEEKAIREKFNVVKKGEKVIMVVDKKDEAPAVENDSEKPAFFSFLRKIFKK